MEAEPRPLPENPQPVTASELHQFRHGLKFRTASELSVFDAVGRDALTFLQSKLTVDTRKWRTSGGSYSLAVDINGKILFDCTCFLIENGARIIIESDYLEAAIAHFDKYVIMEKVSFSPRPDSTVTLIYAQDFDTAEQRLGIARTSDTPEFGGVKFSLSGDAEAAGVAVRLRNEARPAIALISDFPLESELFALGLQPVSRNVVAHEEVRLGIPRIDREYFADQTIPVEAGLWSGLNFNKGCYLGQEVIERLVSRGRPNKRLMQVRWSGSVVAPGTVLQLGDEEAGSVTSCVADGEACVGMAWIRRKFENERDSLVLQNSGQSVQVLGFVGGDYPEGQ